MADLSRAEQIFTVLRSTWPLDWEPLADEYTSPPFVRHLLATDRYVAATPMGLRIEVYLNRDPNMRTCWFVRTRVDGCNDYPLDLWTDPGDIDATDPAALVAPLSRAKRNCSRRLLSRSAALDAKAARFRAAMEIPRG